MADVQRVTKRQVINKCKNVGNVGSFIARIITQKCVSQNIRDSIVPLVRKNELRAV